MKKIRIKIDKDKTIATCLGAFAVIFVSILWILVAFSTAFALVGIGIMIGVPGGYFFVKDHIRSIITRTDDVPEWMKRLVDLSDHYRWPPNSKTSSVLLGLVGPLLLLVCFIWAGASWTALSFPISALSSWVLTVCWLLFYLRIRYGQLR